mmetsp:Transcript_20932/g.37489  ORF Transcript_20932/g.37489 Transcript_20932/m.37489 type:complete len:934 (-) Transcript_20932:40-2841(-)
MPWRKQHQHVNGGSFRYRPPFEPEGNLQNKSKYWESHSQLGQYLTGDDLDPKKYPHLLIERFAPAPNPLEKLTAHFDAMQMHEKSVNFGLFGKSNDKRCTSQRDYAFASSKDFHSEMMKRHDELRKSDNADAPIISVYSFKGGCGKSTSTINLAGGLVAQGYRVGIIDGDAQGNSSAFFSNDKLANAILETLDASSHAPETESCISMDEKNRVNEEDHGDTDVGDDDSHGSKRCGAFDSPEGKTSNYMRSRKTMRGEQSDRASLYMGSSGERMDEGSGYHDSPGRVFSSEDGFATSRTFAASSILNAYDAETRTHVKQEIPDPPGVHVKQESPHRPRPPDSSPPTQSPRTGSTREHPRSFKLHNDTERVTQIYMRDRENSGWDSTTSLGSILSLFIEENSNKLIKGDPTQCDEFEMQRVVFPPDLQGNFGGEIYILPVGDDLPAEDILSNEFTKTPVGSCSFLCSFRMLCHTLARKYKLDVVLVDLGPAKALFNTWVVASSDYVLPPAQATCFGLQASTQMWQKVMPEIWAQQQEWHLKTLPTPGASYKHYSPVEKEKIRRVCIFNPLTKLLPVLINNFDKNRSGQKVVDDFYLNRNGQRAANVISLGLNDSLFIHSIETAFASLSENSNLCSKESGMKLPSPWFHQNNPFPARTHNLSLAEGNVVWMGLENSSLIGLSERRYLPVALLYKTDENFSTLPEGRQRYFDLSGRLADTCNIGMGHKPSLTQEKDVILLVHLLADIVDSVSWPVSKKQFRAAVFNRIRDRIQNKECGWNRFPDAIVESSLKRYEKISQRCDIVLRAHGPYDMNPILVQLEYVSRTNRPRTLDVIIRDLESRKVLAEKESDRGTCQDCYSVVFQYATGKDENRLSSGILQRRDDNAAHSSPRGKRSRDGQPKSDSIFEICEIPPFNGVPCKVASFRGVERIWQSHHK